MLSDIARFHLSLSYGDKDRCITDLNIVIKKYEICNTSKGIENRINHYRKIIIEIEKI